MNKTTEETSTQNEDSGENALESSAAEVKKPSKKNTDSTTSVSESDTEVAESDMELNKENVSSNSKAGTLITDEEETSTSIQYILVTADTQTQVDYSVTLTSMNDKLDTIVSCSIVVMAVVLLSWIHLISRKRRNHK